MQSITHPRASSQVTARQGSPSASKAGSQLGRELVDDAGILNLLHLPVEVHRLPSDPPSRQQATLGERIRFVLAQAGSGCVRSTGLSNGDLIIEAGLVPQAVVPKCVGRREPLD